MSELHELMESIKNSEIYPVPEPELIKEFLLQYDPKLVNEDVDFEDLDELPDEIDRIIKEIFVTKSLKTPLAIKTRFAFVYDNMEWLDDYSISKKNQKILGLDVPYIIQNDDNEEIAWIIFVEYLDSIRFTQIENILKKFVESKSVADTSKDSISDLDIPHEIIFLAGKLDRYFAAEHNILHLQSKDIKLSYCIEFIDPNRPFNNTDWIYVGEEKIRGFNFDSLDSIIELLKRENGPGQYTIICESITGEKQILWEGIIYPKRLIEKQKMGMKE